MFRGSHSRRDQVPTWMVHALLAFIALGLLWSAWAYFIA